MSQVWVVTELYYPEASSTGRVLTNIAEGIAEEFPVSVLCAQPTYEARGAKAPRREHHRGVEIHRVWSTTFDKNRLLGRGVNALTITASFFFRGLKEFRRGDKVMAVTNPPTMPFVISAAARLKGARFVLLVHDTYPDVLWTVGLTGEQSLIAKAWRGMNRGLIRRSSRIIVLGRCALERWARYGGRERMRVIPNYSEPELILPQPREGNPLLARLGLEDKFVIQYAGNMGRSHDLESVAEACRIVAQRDPSIHWLFIGSGARKPLLEQAARELPDSVTVLDYQKRDSLSDVLNACDWALISQSKGMSGISIPSRMYNVFCTGRPLIAAADEDAELSLCVAERELGIIVPPGDPEALAQAVLSLRESAPAPGLVERSRRLAEEASLDRVAAAYRDALREA